MKITAQVVPWSSVVGSGVMLLNGKGRCIGQVMFICHTDDLRNRDAQVGLSEIICDAINAARDRVED